MVATSHARAGHMVGTSRKMLTRDWDGESSSSEGVQ